MSLWFGSAPSGATLAVASDALAVARLRFVAFFFFLTHLPRLSVRPFLHFGTHLPLSNRCFEVQRFGMTGGVGTSHLYGMPSPSASLSGSGAGGAGFVGGFAFFLR